VQKKNSIQGTKIIFERETLDESISSILEKRFSDPTILEKNIDNLYDPYLMCDMEKAVDRIEQAKKGNERVVVF